MRSLVFVRHLTGKRRQQDEGQYKNTCGQCYKDSGVNSQAIGKSIGYQYDHCALEKIIIECSKEHRSEKRGKLSRAKEGKLILPSGSFRRHLLIFSVNGAVLSLTMSHSEQS
jgi:hypothetical protein